MVRWGVFSRVYASVSNVNYQASIIRPSTTHIHTNTHAAPQRSCISPSALVRSARYYAIIPPYICRIKSSLTQVVRHTWQNALTLRVCFDRYELGTRYRRWSHRRWPRRKCSPWRENKGNMCYCVILLLPPNLIELGYTMLDSLELRGVNSWASSIENSRWNAGDAAASRHRWAENVQLPAIRVTSVWTGFVHRVFMFSS